MKKILKSRVFLIIVCAIVFTSVGAVTAVTISARNITYKETNVESAIDDLYILANTPKSLDISTITSSSASINASFGTRVSDRSTSLNLGAGKYVVTATKAGTYGNNDRNESGDEVSFILAYSGGTCNKVSGKYTKYGTTEIMSMFHRYTAYICEFNSNTTVSVSASFEDDTNASRVQSLIINAIKLD